MPPQQPASTLGIKWHEVMWYSKLGAIILFLGVVPALCFYIGTQYELAKQASVIPTPQQSSTKVSTEIPGALPASYQWISLPDAEKQGLICTSDANSLTYCKTLLSMVDAPTFVIGFYLSSPRPPYSLLANFAKDKNHVYFLSYKTLEVVREADVASFTPLQFGGIDGYAKDKNYAYWDWFVIPNADTNTFSTVSPGYPFAKDKNYVYDGELYRSGIDNGFVVKGADPNTFVNLGGNYAQDKNHIYYVGGETVIVLGADTTSFLPTQRELQCGRDCWYDAQDKNHKYHIGQAVQ